MPEKILEACIDEQDTCIRRIAIEVAELKVKFNDRNMEEHEARMQLVQTAKELDIRLDAINRMIDVNISRINVLMWIFGIFAASIIALVILVVIHILG